MKRIMMMVALAAFMVAALSVSALSAFAASSEQQCEGAGGEFSRTNGAASCEQDPVVVPAKNSGQEKFQKETQTTETGQGNLDNKDDDTTTPTCGKPCPPGQFPK